MFMKKIDWDDARFKKWNLTNLGPLNEAQQAAFFDEDASYIYISLILCAVILNDRFNIFLFFIVDRILIFPILVKWN